MKTSLSFSNNRSTLEVISLPELGLIPVKWKLAKLDLDIGFPSMARANVGSKISNQLFNCKCEFQMQNCILSPNVSPSNVGKSERVMMSAALRGLVNGITECGNVFG